jgi:hypothetical protein
LRASPNQSVRKSHVCFTSAFIVDKFIGAFWFIVVDKLGSKASLCCLLQVSDSQQPVSAAWWRCSTASAAAQPPVVACFAIFTFEFSFVVLN